MKASSATPIYLQVAEELRSQIHANKWTDGAKLPPEVVFAKQFGTSRQTFRKALNILVRQGIIRQHKGKGTFVSNTSVKSAPKTRLGLMGVSAEEIGRDPYWTLFIEGIHEGLASLGEFELVFMGGAKGDLAVHRHHELNGFFIFPTYLDALRLAGPELNSVPHVCLCTSLPVLRRNDNVFVDSDNVAAAMNVIDYLVGLGHRNIAHIQVAWPHCHPRDRAEGFRQGAEKHGISPEHARIYPVSAKRTIEILSQEVRIILEGPKRPTAIFAGGFYVALSVMAAAKSLGLRIPDDLSLVGFDDFESGAFVSPPLTTVRQPLHEMGVQAAEMMALQLAHKPLKSRQVVLQAELIVRESCRAIVPASDKRQSRSPF